MKLLALAFSLLLAPVAGLVAWQAGSFSQPAQFWQALPFAWPALAIGSWILLAWLLRIPLAGRPGVVPWTAVSKFFHWVMALSILGTTALMYYMVNMGDLATDTVLRAEYSRLLRLHKSLGLLVLFLVVLRFAWNRIHPRPPLPAGISPAQRSSALGAHHALYALMLCVPLVGWTASMTYGARTSFFGLFEMPVWLPKSEKWVAILQPAHIYMARGLLALVGIHLAAALWHHFGKRDATLVQMLPGKPRRGR
jgi:cytochrome b561